VPDLSAASLEALPPSRRAILTELKQRGEARAEELADALAITVSAVRQHIAGLVTDGLVVHRQITEGPGRPKHVYRLTSDADGLFPRAYGDLANELLDSIAGDDPTLVDRAFARRRDRRIRDARGRLDGLPLPARVVELAKILDEDGYLAEAVEEGDGAWRIVEHNCAILAVARRYGSACSSEIEFLREVLPDATVDRVSHMVAGAHHCAYEVRAR
jgi:DeoR family suf operon transcriptional repressor